MKVYVLFPENKRGRVEQILLYALCILLPTYLAFINSNSFMSFCRMLSKGLCVSLIATLCTHLPIFPRFRASVSKASVHLLSPKLSRDS